jgi:hypothetical protein
VAHPNLTGAPNRKLLTAGLTAAVLALPLGGTAMAADLTVVDVDKMTVEQLLDAGLVEEAAKKAGVPAADVEEVTKTVEKTTAPVTQTVEKTVTEAAPAKPPADTGDKTPVTTDSGDQKATGGGGPTPVNEPAARTSGSRGGEERRATSTPPTFDQNGPVLSGLQSRTVNPSMQSFVPPPVVSAPFAFDLPQVAEQFVSPQAPIAAAAEVSSLASGMTATPVNDMVPSGVPGALLATAAGLLLFVGGGHALHAYDRRWRTVEVTTGDVTTTA